MSRLGYRFLDLLSAASSTLCRYSEISWQAFVTVSVDSERHHIQRKRFGMSGFLQLPALNLAGNVTLIGLTSNRGLISFDFKH